MRLINFLSTDWWYSQTRLKFFTIQLLILHMFFKFISIFLSKWYPYWVKLGMGKAQMSYKSIHQFWIRFYNSNHFFCQGFKFMILIVFVIWSLFCGLAPITDNLNPIIFDSYLKFESLFCQSFSFQKGICTCKLTHENFMKLRKFYTAYLKN